MRVLRGQPLHSRRAGYRGALRCWNRSAHRRYQARPIAARRPTHRPAGHVTARRRRRRFALVRLDQRRDPRCGAVGERGRADAAPADSQRSRARHRRVLCLQRRSGAANHRRRDGAGPTGVVRRAVHGAQHGNRARPGISAGGRVGSGRHRRRRDDGARPGCVDHHRNSGRADGGAVADVARRASQHHADVRRPDHPVVLADTGQRGGRLRGDRRASQDWGSRCHQSASPRACFGSRVFG